MIEKWKVKVVSALQWLASPFNVNLWVQVKMQILGNSDTPRLWLWTVMSILGNICWLPDGALIAGVGSDGCDGLTKMIAVMTSKNDCPSGDDIKVGIVLVLQHQARMALLAFQGHALAECFRSSKCQQKMSGNDFVCKHMYLVWKSVAKHFLNIGFLLTPLQSWSCSGLVNRSVSSHSQCLTVGDADILEYKHWCIPFH